MITHTLICVAGLCCGAAAAQPGQDQVIRWYNSEIERARRLSVVLSDTPVLVSYRRTDTFTYTTEQESALRANAQLHPQSRARVDLQRMETARSRGGLVVEHRLWVGRAGFRHNQDLQYEAAGTFVDSVSGKESGWSLTPHAINRLPVVASAESRGRGAEQFRLGFLQDLLPSLTGGLSEVIKREFEQPTVAVSEAGVAIFAQAPRDRFVSGMKAEVDWDAGTSSGRITSLTIVSRGGPGSDELFRFSGWSAGSGMVYAQRAIRNMPSLNKTTAVDISAVGAISEVDVERAIAEPSNPRGGKLHVDSIRGELSLGSRTTYGTRSPLSERLTESGSVRVDVYDSSAPDLLLRLLGWVLGGGIVSSAVAFYCWKRQQRG